MLYFMLYVLFGFLCIVVAFALARRTYENRHYSRFSLHQSTFEKTAINPALFSADASADNSSSHQHHHAIDCGASTHHAGGGFDCGSVGGGHH